jgi:hypothetical protein
MNQLTDKDKIRALIAKALETTSNEDITGLMNACPLMTGAYEDAWDAKEFCDTLMGECQQIQNRRYHAMEEIDKLVKEHEDVDQYEPLIPDPVTSSTQD